MPKELYEIRRFNLGIISSPSETDIPVDAASFSLDVDPIIEGGKLGGMPGHTLQTAAASAAMTADQLAFVQAPDGTRTLMYADHSATDMKYVEDFDGTRSAVQTAESSFDADNDYAAISQRGSELHIGMGSSKAAKWIGYNQSGQFGDAPSGDVVSEDAGLLKLYDTVSIDGGLGVHKIVYVKAASPSSISYALLGIEWQGTKILAYGDSYATDFPEIELTSGHTGFTSLQAMCLDKSSNTRFWLYDNDDTDNGTIYLCQLNGNKTITIVKSMPIAGWGEAGLEDPSSYTVSDMILDNGDNEKYIWFSMYDQGGGVPIVGGRSEDPSDVRVIDDNYSVGYPTLLFRSSGKSTGTLDGSPVSTVNVTPNLDATDESQALQGKLRLENDVDNTFHRFDLVTLKKPLVNISEEGGTYDSWVGWWCAFKSVTSSPKITTDVAENWRPIGLSMYVISHSVTAGQDLRPGQTGCKIIQLSTDGFEYNDPPYYDTAVSRFQAELIIGPLVGAELMVVCTQSIGGISFRAFSASELESELDEAAVFDTGNTPPTIRMLHDFSGNEKPIDTIATSLKNASMVSKSSYDDGTTMFVFTEDGGLAKYYFTINYSGGPTVSMSAGSVVAAADFIFTASESNRRADGVRAGDTHKYYIALEYDGTQVGPTGDPVMEHRISKDGSSVDLTLRVQEDLITGLSSRITGMYILRSRTSVLTGADNSIPRVIGRIDLSEEPTTSSYLGVSGYAAYKLTDNNTPAETFEQLAGYSSEADSCTPQYGISCVGEDRLLVGDCGGIETFTDASNIIMISQPGCYDQFNMTTDFIILSEKPTAMAYWRGRFYVFSKNKMWRINPNGFYIEDDFDGIGCEGPQAVIANEFGIFVAGTNGIYLDRGQGFQSIGDPILYGEAAPGWLERNTDKLPVAFFEPKRRAFCAAFKAGSLTYSFVYAYSIAQNRWDLWTLTSGVLVADIRAGSSGDLYGCDGSNVYLLFEDDDSRRPYAWHSKVIDLGAGTEEKKFYEVRCAFDGSTAPTFTLSNQDDGSVSSSTASVANLSIVTIGSTARRQRGVKVKISQTDGSVLIDSVGIQYRLLQGTH